LAWQTGWECAGLPHILLGLTRERLSELPKLLVDWLLSLDWLPRREWLSRELLPRELLSWRDWLSRLLLAGLKLSLKLKLRIELWIARLEPRLSGHGLPAWLRGRQKSDGRPLARIVARLARGRIEARRSEAAWLWHQWTVARPAEHSVVHRLRLPRLDCRSSVGVEVTAKWISTKWTPAGWLIPTEWISGELVRWIGSWGRRLLNQGIRQ
jgi:hypothetical protein